MTNSERAESADAALQVFHQQVKSYDFDTSDANEVAEDISDLICNLGHLADRHGLDFRELAAQGIGMWSAEKRAHDHEPSSNDIAEIIIKEV